MEFVTDTYDDGSSLDLIYLDFSKAFDKVPHEKLMKKRLKQLGSLVTSSDGLNIG